MGEGEIDVRKRGWKRVRELVLECEREKEGGGMGGE